jgi:hypothetical protein
MTNCDPRNINFSPLNSKKVIANFNGGAIGSDGGLLLLRETDKQIRLTKKISQVFSDHRHQSYIEHSIEHMLKQRVYAIAAGYEDVNDHDYLRNDLCFQTSVGREVALASSATLSRFENSINRKALVDISKALVEHFIDRHKTAPVELVLDFDPTDNRIYGHQERRHYHGYYQDYCYLPLHVFCGEHLLVSLLRSSDIDGAKYSGAILKLLVKRFREVWPEVKIVFRGDSGFARKRILHWCENNNVKYIIGIGANSRLQKLAESEEKQVETLYKISKEKQKTFSEFCYKAESWNNERRIIVKTEYNDKGPNTRFLVTNKTDIPQDIYDNHYCPRGDMENNIKQLKLDLHSDRNSCHDFMANYFRILLSSIAYILLTELKHTHLKKTTLAKAYCGTVQLKLLKIGVMILKNTRSIKFLFASHHAYQNDFIVAAQSLVPS